MPDLGTVNLPAIPAVNLAGEDVPACGVAVLPPFQLVLHPSEGFRRDDGGMVLLHIVLGDLAMVFQPVLAQEVDAVSLLEQLVAHVGLVRQDPADGRVAPLRLPGRGGDAVLGQPFGDLERRVSRKEIPEDAAHDLCLLLVDYKPSVLALVVAEEMLVLRD